MAKIRRVIKDAAKSASVSQEQVKVAAQKIKANRPAVFKAKPDVLKNAPTLHPNSYYF